MFGYACDETPELMPAPIRLAHRLIEAHARASRRGELDFLRPDAKSQVTVEYADDKPARVTRRRALDPARPGRAPRPAAQST